MLNDIRLTLRKSEISTRSNGPFGSEKDLAFLAKRYQCALHVSSKRLQNVLDQKVLENVTFGVRFWRTSHVDIGFAPFNGLPLVIVVGVFVDDAAAALLSS